MPIPEPEADLSGDFFTRVDDEQYEELNRLAGEQVVFVALWEESVATAIEDADAGDGLAVDLDLYLAPGVYFELYGVVCYRGLDDPPLADLGEIDELLQALVQQTGHLSEVAVDEEDGLVLVLGRGDEPALYLQVGAWILAEWEELPDASES